MNSVQRYTMVNVEYQPYKERGRKAIIKCTVAMQKTW